MGLRHPNLFIIGAMKAGTSSLHEYLHQHPEIFMSRFKEPQYFAPHTTRTGLRWGEGRPCPEPGIEWYLKLFQAGGEVRYAGESSVSYTAAPWVTGCAARIHRFNPDARFIYIVRDPVERAISHYWHFVADGRETRTPLQAVVAEQDYVARSNYAMQLRPYIDQFGLARIFVLTLEELQERPGDIFSSLFRWLGVAEDVEIKTSSRFNVGADELRQTRRSCVPIDTARKHWRWEAIENTMPLFASRLVKSIAYKKVRRSDVDTTDAVIWLRRALTLPSNEFSVLLARSFPE